MTPLTVQGGWPLVALVAAAAAAWWLGHRLVVACLLVAIAAVAGLGPVVLGGGPAGGPLAAGAPVPAELRPWIDRAGSICPEVTPALLAAQLNQESGFNPRARSSVGAMGIAQFMPGTWRSWAVDADGDGASPWDPPDAITAQGRLMCALAARYGGRTDLALAAYNAGPGPVDAAGAVPAISETRRYVTAIRALVATYTDPAHL